MELETAVSLIQKGVDAGTGKQQWADLGAGSGLFSQALATLLPAGSSILAIDKEYGNRPPAIKHPSTVSITTASKDFGKENTGISNYDGILLANSIHYIRDKSALLLQLKDRLKPSGRFIIIEYDTNRSNQWVPYPISYTELEKLCVTISLGSIQKIASHSSRYQSQGMYAALIQTVI